MSTPRFWCGVFPEPPLPDPTNIFGRASLISSVRPSCERRRGAWLHGPGGVGKSTIAHAVALLLGPALECVWWIDAAGLVVSESIVALDAGLDLDRVATVPVQASSAYKVSRTWTGR